MLHGAALVAGAVMGAAVQRTPHGVAAAPPPPILPIPPHSIPSNLFPPLASGRNDVHGWLWLAMDHGAGASATSEAESDPDAPVTELKGWFYHHTPEFWWNSPHNFEIMVAGTLKLDHGVTGLPLAPEAVAMGTEYVFTPPAFSLDQLITRKATSFYGHFTNGSFDTKQYYILSNGTLTVDAVPTVHYLWDNNHTQVEPMPQQAYLSYPRAGPLPASNGAHATSTGNQGLDDASQAPAATLSTAGVAHLYWLHMLWSAPDYDQIVHVTVDPASCVFRHGDTVADVVAVGATFVTQLQNHVLTRLHEGVHTVELATNASHGASDKTTCTATVLREVHCVVMPDSFAKCPPVASVETA